MDEKRVRLGGVRKKDELCVSIIKAIEATAYSGWKVDGRDA